MGVAGDGVPEEAQDTMSEVVGWECADGRGRDEGSAQSREENKGTKKHGEAPKRAECHASSSETNGKDAAIVLR